VHKLSPFLVGGLAAILSACGGSDQTSPDPLSASAEDTAPADSAPVVESQTAEEVSNEAAALSTSVEEDPIMRKGKIAFLRCRSCHTLEKDGAHLTGPNLNGFFGAPAGAKEGYYFSDALIEKNIVWNEETLDAWIENPSAYVPGNRMVFAGLRKPEDREALIAYLIEETK